MSCADMKREEGPNDPKLSDRGGWRECCAVGLLGAALVTAVAVRCSAWLGDVGSDIANGALWFRLLWLGVIQAGLIVVLVLLIRIIAELRREQKQYEREKDQNVSKTNKFDGLPVETRRKNLLSLRNRN